jgi:hypothetical protein
MRRVSFQLLLFFLPFDQSLGAALDVWNWRNPLPQGNSLNSVAYGNGQFLAVGNGATLPFSLASHSDLKHGQNPGVSSKSGGRFEEAR